MNIETLRIASLRIDERCQPRAVMDYGVASTYAEAMRAGDGFPPLVVFRDDTGAHWLADGFHRRAAAEMAGLAELPCQVRPGGLRAAILYACGANETHGVRRSNEDKRRAVRRLLEDEEWRQWSSNKIAQACRVSNHLVDELRATVTWNSPSEEPAAERTYVTKHGTTATMNTEAIGKRPRAPTWADEPEPTPEEKAREQAEIALTIIASCANLPPARELLEALTPEDRSIIIEDAQIVMRKMSLIVQAGRSMAA